MSRWKGRLVNGLLVVGALLCAFILAEFGLRVAAPQPTGLSHQDRYGLALHWPNMTRRLPQFGTTASFNSAGMRDREHALDKPAGVYRVLVLGDSFMEALQVEFEASLPSLLEHSLAERTGKRIEVINAGVSGWGTGDALRYLSEYGLRYQPDLVLVAMTLHNDVDDNLRAEWFALQGDSLVERRRFQMSTSRYRVVQLKAFLASRFQTYQLWRKVRRRGDIRRVGTLLDEHIIQLFRAPPSERIVSGYRLTELLLQRMDSVSKANRAGMAIVLLPLRVQLTDSSFAEFVRTAGVADSEMPPEKPQRFMTAAGQRLGVSVIDLLPAFRQWTAAGRPPLYLEHDGHWNSTGHRLAASTVMEGLLGLGVLR